MIPEVHCDLFGRIYAGNKNSFQRNRSIKAGSATKNIAWSTKTGQGVFYNSLQKRAPVARICSVCSERCRRSVYRCSYWQQNASVIKSRIYMRLSVCIRSIDLNKLLKSEISRAPAAAPMKFFLLQYCVAVTFYKINLIAIKVIQAKTILAKSFCMRCFVACAKFFEFNKKSYA